MKMTKMKRLTLNIGIGIVDRIEEFLGRKL
jgi:hypothetical protein